MEAFNEFLNSLNSIVWGPWMLTLLVGTGFFLTFRLGLLQITKLGYAFKLVMAKPKTGEDGDISHFQALMTALAATIGTGNIVGVATAISVGGPGALFWMWVTAAVGMATKYAEAILAVKYRIQDDKGEMSGGPMYYIEKGLNMKWLAVLFALFGSIAAFGIGNMVQANAVATNVQSMLNLDTWVTGLILAIFTALVVLGGIKNIGKVTGVMVPFMSLVYVLGGIIILVKYAAGIPAALGMVFTDAFTGTAATGGFLGATVALAIQKGVARGVFSNESGLGSAPIAAAAAKTKEPAEQALVSMTGTFIDTIIVCTMTGLALILTGVWNQEGLEAGIMTKVAFETAIPGGLGGVIVGIGIIFFAYSTILGWAYYGEKCFQYLLGAKAVLPYRYLWVIFVFVGATMELDLVWLIADVMNGLMAAPNLIALLGLSGVVAAETKKYFDKLENQQLKS